MTSDPALRTPPDQHVAHDRTVADQVADGKTVLDSGPSAITMVIGEPPPVVGGWKLGKRIGTGGMGAVHLATKDNRQGALKLMHAQLVSTGDFRARFLREAEVLRAIHHPNVVQLLDHGENDGWLWLVMEFVPGGDLAQHLSRRGQMFEKEAATIIARCCRGMQAIHAAGLVHRDLKPENIFLVPNGGTSMAEPKIGDLGMARHTGGDDRMTLTGTACGTPSYMAPEQIRGSGDLDARCDVYALGATLFTLLTGRKPFEGPTAYVLTHQVLTKPVPDMRKWNPLITPAACAVVEKAMAKERDERHRDVGELLLDLERLAEGKSPLLSAVLPSPASLVFQEVAGQAAPKRSSLVSGSEVGSSLSGIPWGAVLRMGVPAVLIIGLLSAVGWIIDGKTKTSSRPNQGAATTAQDPTTIGSLERDERGALVRLAIANQQVILRWCQPGTFTMGSPIGEAGRLDTEDVHQVKLNHGFWILDREVTQTTWNALAVDDVRTGDGPSHPVSQVTLDQCLDWLERLNQMNPRLSARLPTEAEWEYACRAGSSGALSVEGALRWCVHPQVLAEWRGTPGGLFAAEGARMLDPDNPQLHSVVAGSTPSNLWGISGMHDNVAEWCADRWDGDNPYGEQPRSDPLNQFGSLNVVRGGSWLHPPERSRSAARLAVDPGMAKPWLGFRFIVPGGQTASWPPR